MATNAEQDQLNTANQNQVESSSQAPNVAGAAAPIAGSNNRVANYSSGTAPSKGSGRFTNLQNYIGANQGAGDRLAQGINGNLNRSSADDKQKTETQASSVREGIESAQNKLNTGSGYLNQIGQNNFNANDITDNADKLNEFTNFRTNQAVDPNTLKTNLAGAQAQSAQYQNVLQNQANQANTESGRFNLLKNAFNGGSAAQNPYSAGQQRLDQLFLQSGGNNGVQTIQNNIKNNLSAASDMNAGINAFGGQINDVGNNASTLASNLQNKTGELETGYINNLQNQVAGVNAGRDTSRDQYQRFFNGVTGHDPSNPLNQDLLNSSGLKQGEQTFNVLNNPLLTSDKYVNFDNRNANDYHDIATSQDVNRYGALSKLAGIDPGKLSQTGMLVDPATGQLSNAASFKTGQGSLRSDLDTAKQQFLDNATQTNLTGNGQANYGTVFGDGVANIYKTGNAMDYLNGVDTNPLPTTQYLGGVTDATNKANTDLQSQLQAYLDQAGFGNYIGANGLTSGASNLQDFGYGDTTNSTRGIYNPKNDIKV